MNLARKRLAARCRTLQKVEIARQVGVTPGFIGAVLRGRKRPGPKLLAYLELEAYEAYRQRRAVSGVASLGHS
jgi:hypothetical protein